MGELAGKGCAGLHAGAWDEGAGGLHAVDSGRVEVVPGSLVWAGWRQHSGRYPRHRNWVKEEEEARLCVREGGL